MLVCLCICFYMYVYLFVSLLVCLFVYAYNNKAFICLFICLSFVCLFVWLSLHLIMKRLPVRLFSFWLFAQWWSLCLKIKCIFMGVFVCLFSSFSFFFFIIVYIFNNEALAWTFVLFAYFFIYLVFQASFKLTFFQI